MVAGADIVRAQSSDDPELRRLLRDMPMKGDISIAFTREPSYFDAAAVEGDHVDVLVARSRNGNHIVGMGARSEKNAFVNGQPSRVGYLSGLRIRPEYQTGTILLQAFQELQKLRHERGVALYLTTIIEDNDAVRKILTMGGGGMPVYSDLGRYVTVVLNVAGEPQGPTHDVGGIHIRRASAGDRQALIEFLVDHGARRQFFPVYQETDFENGLLRGLRMEDILLALRGGKIHGCLALWDQRPYKQSIVIGYSERFQQTAHALTRRGGTVGGPALPPPGSPFGYVTFALCCVAQDRLDIFRALFSNAMAAIHEMAGIDAALAGFHSDDLLINVAKQWPHLAYNSRLYVVHWADDRHDFEELDDRIPYLELGSL